MHRSTLEIKLKFFHFVKLSSHNASLYHPLQRQNTQKQMAHRIIGMADIWTPRDWRSWCKALGPQGSLPKRPLLAGMVQRKAAKRSVRTLPKATVKKSFQKTKFLCTHSAQKETYETSSFCFACSKSARASRTAVSYCIDGCQNPTETTSTAVWKTLEFAACRRYVCLRGRFS